MRRLFSICAALALLLAATAQANASVMVLTFEGVGDLNSVGNYYNGGAGPNYGVSFSSNTLAVVGSYDGGSGNFTNPPSGDTVMFFLTGSASTMDVAAGFDTGFSFYYSAQVGTTAGYTVYSGLDGTGSVLATGTLGATPDPYNVWVPVGVSFAGTAESVVFAGVANFAAFDDVTFGSATAGGSATPEPASLALFGIGIAGLAGYGWKRRKVTAK